MTARSGTIAIVDSGVANLASVLSAVRRIGFDAEVTSDAACIRAAGHVILPGVGAAATAMQQLRRRNLVGILQTLAQPVLGICLGMQLLFARSQESVDAPVECLGLLPGDIMSLRGAPETPVPHMGWNELSLLAPGHALLRGLDDGSFVYFAHSYAAPVSTTALATTNYKQVFASIVGDRNFFGCQFHPERSGAVGGRLLKNFLDM